MNSKGIIVIVVVELEGLHELLGGELSVVS